MSANQSSVKLPVIYEDAIRDLIACQTLDEAKYFADKAEALAAFAKIHSDQRLRTEAARLKMYAWRRMGQLSEELQPRKGFQAPGPGALLKLHGFSTGVVEKIRGIALIPNKQFDEAMARPEAPTIRGLLLEKRLGNPKNSSKSWVIFGSGYSPGLNAASFRAFCRRHDAKRLAIDLHADEAAKAREMAREIIEWLDRFEQYLPKEAA